MKNDRSGITVEGMEGGKRGMRCVVSMDIDIREYVPNVIRKILKKRTDIPEIVLIILEFFEKVKPQFMKGACSPFALNKLSKASKLTPKLNKEIRPYGEIRNIRFQKGDKIKITIDVLKWNMETFLDVIQEEKWISINETYEKIVYSGIGIINKTLKEKMKEELAISLVNDLHEEIEKLLEKEAARYGFELKIGNIRVVRMRHKPQIA